MASSNELKDIMGISEKHNSLNVNKSEITKEEIYSMYEKPKKNISKKVDVPKRPDGMARELFYLICNDSERCSDSAKDKGYKQMKAKLGMRKVRPWKWMPFTNPARRDNLVLYHWRRQADEGKEYAFARFNKKLEMPTFSDIEYQNHLTAEGWTRAETEHLLDLCGRFDLRFTVIQDRWDRTSYPKPKSIEDLKERYYGIVEKLETLHADPSKAAAKTFAYDADHERRRKEQLCRLYDRTPEQVEEEEILRAELKKIEARKKEREKKTQDLQKLIMQADSSAKLSSQVTSDKKSKKKSTSTSRQSAGNVTKDFAATAAVLESAGIKFPSTSGSGVTLRSQRMKLPQSVGQKKTKAIEQMLGEIDVELAPIPTEAMCNEFNELRSEMVLLYELKNALAACEQELHSLKGQFEAACPGKSLEIPDKLKPPNPTQLLAKGERPTKNISDVIDVVGNGPAQPVRKRKAALEQSHWYKSNNDSLLHHVSDHFKQNENC